MLTYLAVPHKWSEQMVGARNARVFVGPAHLATVTQVEDGPEEISLTLDKQLYGPSDLDQRTTLDLWISDGMKYRLSCYVTGQCSVAVVNVKEVG